MIRINFSKYYATAFIGLRATFLWADDPILNIMPRWDDGWGYQFIEEYRHESDLLLGSQSLYPGFSEDVHLLHFESVYTWDKSVRVTFKLPYVLSARREMPDGLGGKKIEKDSGIGDPTISLPLKKYFNLDGMSGSYTFKPMVRLPFSSGGDYEIYDGEWGNGIGFGYEQETSKWYFGVSTSGWVSHGSEPFESHSSIDLGYNFNARGTNGSFLWETDLVWEDDGSETLLSGPAFYWNVNDTLHWKFEWKHDLHDRQGILDHGNGDIFKFSIGWVF